MQVANEVFLAVLLSSYIVTRFHCKIYVFVGGGGGGGGGGLNVPDTFSCLLTGASFLPFPVSHL